MIATLLLDLLQLLVCAPAGWAMAGFPCCCGTGGVACSQCPGETGPRYFQIVFEGIVDDDCADCDEMNATFLVDFEYPSPCEFFDELGSANPGDNGGVICVWVYDADPRIACDHPCVYLTIQDVSATEFTIAAYIRRGVNEWIRLERTIDTEDPGFEDFNCQLDGLELTDCTALYIAASDRCACGGSAKATVTAVG